MSMTISELELLYPTSDGKPMAENTEQFEWIVKLQGGLDAYYANDPDVFVAGDLLWYPVEGNSKIRQAPDAMVVFGRPKGKRGSYMQWLENGLGPQVVFEVLSPGNRAGEMRRKLKFYEDHGVQEYYIYKPMEPLRLKVYRRRGSVLKPVKVSDGMRSPLLRMTFDLSGEELVVRKPNGEPLLTYLEQDTQRQEALIQAQLDRASARQAGEYAEQEHQRAELLSQRAEQERQRAEQERQRAELQNQRAEQERQRAEQERQRAEQEHQRAELQSQRAEQEHQRAELQSQRAEKAEQELAELRRLLGQRDIGKPPQQGD